MKTSRSVRVLVVVAVPVLLAAYACWSAIAIYRTYMYPKDREERRFANDLNSDLGTALGISCSWDYKQGEVIITTYRVLHPADQASVRAGLLRLLARSQQKRPASVTSVRLRFCRDPKDREAVAEFELPAVISPEKAAEWAEDPGSPATGKERDSRHPQASGKL
jgi:hypothetical protein